MRQSHWWGIGVTVLVLALLGVSVRGCLGRDLRATIRRTATQIIVTNDESAAWQHVTLTINPRGTRGGYHYQVEQIAPGESYTVGLLQFADTDGERFDPFTHTIQQFEVTASTGSGNGVWYGSFD